MARPPYQFRQKQSANAEQQVVTTSNAKVDDTLYDMSDFTHRFHDFMAEKGKYIYGVLGGIALIAVAFVAYKFMWAGPNEQKAAEKIFKAEQMLAKDSFEVAVQGRPGAFSGFADIVDNYGSTSSGNLAKYYIGVAALQKGNYDQAIEFLESYSPSGKILPAMTKGALGDAYSEKGDMEKALSYYESAANANDNQFTAPYYLWKAGMLAEHLKKLDEAKEYFERIKSEYPRTEQGMEIEMHLARVSK